MNITLKEAIQIQNDYYCLANGYFTAEELCEYQEIQSEQFAELVNEYILEGYSSWEAREAAKAYLNR